ncbi:unnamed protein product [Onchocerca flexuosa]|uniref:Uncharacterized protein n=1 Tax=Onchocerca flexuosa TaxID=387005 RepID=A0A183H3F5_9BILA|nr:unnamed protein product [Onchocerca flexuosa]
MISLSRILHNGYFTKFRKLTKAGESDILSSRDNLPKHFNIFHSIVSSTQQALRTTFETDLYRNDWGFFDISLCSHTTF